MNYRLGIVINKIMARLKAAEAPVEIVALPVLIKEPIPLIQRALSYLLAENMIEIRKIEGSNYAVPLFKVDVP